VVMNFIRNAFVADDTSDGIFLNEGQVNMGGDAQGDQEQLCCWWMWPWTRNVCRCCVQMPAEDDKINSPYQRGTLRRQDFAPHAPSPCRKIIMKPT
jgi:hypothetical protein